MFWTIFVVCFIIVVVFLLKLNYYLDGRRRAAMGRAAAALGYQFLGPRYLTSMREGYPTRLLRARGRMTNVMVGNVGCTMAIVFDDVMCTGDSNKTQTVAGFHVQLPAFEMRRRMMGDRLGSTPDTISFSYHQEFDPCYVVRTPDGPATRQLLAPEVLTSLVEQSTSSPYAWAIESTGEWLFIFRDQRPEIFSWMSFAGSEWKVPPANVPAFLQEAATIAAIFGV
ncbi:MAG TPA: hypothetical protein VHV83_05680 [Armatimonadota bacterium]|nr:hypothetical protein [Armatimonadota bacterium]